MFQYLKHPAVRENITQKMTSLIWGGELTQKMTFADRGGEKVEKGSSIDYVIYEQPHNTK